MSTTLPSKKSACALFDGIDVKSVSAGFVSSTLTFLLLDWQVPIL